MVRFIGAKPFRQNDFYIPALKLSIARRLILQTLDNHITVLSEAKKIFKGIKKRTRYVQLFYFYWVGKRENHDLQ